MGVMSEPSLSHCTPIFHDQTALRESDRRAVFHRRAPTTHVCSQEVSSVKSIPPMLWHRFQRLIKHHNSRRNPCSPSVSVFSQELMNSSQLDETSLSERLEFRLHEFSEVSRYKSHHERGLHQAHLRWLDETRSACDHRFGRIQYLYRNVRPSGDDRALATCLNMKASTRWTCLDVSEFHHLVQPLRVGNGHREFL